MNDREVKSTKKAASPSALRMITRNIQVHLRIETRIRCPSQDQDRYHLALPYKTGSASGPPNTD